ncbi:hypothetical protein Rsub_12475 [Raphidocelis subcapitata]|uniref:C2 domain-containing protein n=1 Tax=Raphidocelis subcapitata TaxID=307507 RepID=A0A2V0PIW9_9CHLO|nr:hypothetical protein Rsub_12475 [Raphidocelis subcapitata]|eukprot:GBF99656.1 hypothetical protein Rsub_12475 [Raphidocelis subcapitata]
MAEKPKGFLSFRPIEASGLNKDEQYVWPSSDFEGFVKVELRGGPRNVKAATRRVGVQGSTIFWNEPLVLEVLDNANELRVMLCKDKVSQLPDGTTKRGTQVVAACGIYVSDILDAVPIDKYFELFRPGAGGDGGFIRLSLDYSTERPQYGYGNGVYSGGKQKKRRGWLLPVLLLAVAGAGAFFGKKYYDEQQKDKKPAGKGAAAAAKKK